MTKKVKESLRKDNLETYQKHLYWEDLLSKYPTFDNVYDYMKDLFSYTDENGVVRERPQGGGLDIKIIEKAMLQTLCEKYNIGK